MYYDVLLQLRLYSVSPYFEHFLCPPNNEAVMHEWLLTDLGNLIIPIDK